MNQLQSLKQFSIVAADTINIKSICYYNPQNVTTNPSLILRSIHLIDYQTLIEDALTYAKQKGGTKEIQTINASNKLAVNIGMKILKYIPGYISTEIDIKSSFNYDMCIIEAHKLIDLYRENNIDKSRILIKIAATWEGIQAAKELEKDGIHCNLTLIFSFEQAVACAEAGVYLISPFVGRIHDWYYQNNLCSNIIENDPGITLVHKIYKYYKQHNYKTIVMGASLRTIHQILNLSGCDQLTISPFLLQELYTNQVPIKRKLFPCNNDIYKLESVSKAEFLWKHIHNIMAMNKLAEGIRNFAIDQEKLKQFLITRL